MNDGSDNLEEAFSPIALPCGLTVQNRFVKAAMYEHGARYTGGPPNAYHYSLYEKWAQGGWGMIITGNIQIDPSHITLGADMVFPRAIRPETITPFHRLAAAIHDENRPSNLHKKKDRFKTLAIAQVNHSGRQATNFIGGRFPFFPPISASRTRVQPRHDESFLARLVYHLLFQAAKEMTLCEIDSVVDGFVNAAKIAFDSGFDGIQLHAAHGYLLAQFISRTTNLRKDEYREPLNLLRRICKSIRDVVPPTFALGVKLNATDYVSGGLTQEDAKLHIEQIATWGVDFIEITGGDYESPDFMARASGRQAFFESFAEHAIIYLSKKYYEFDHNEDTKTHSRPLIMLTGGLRTSKQLSSALRKKHADLLGLGRMSVLYPDLPHLLLSHHTGNAGMEFVPVDDPSPRTPKWWPKLIGAGVGMAWYIVRMRSIAAGLNVPFRTDAITTVLTMYLGDMYIFLKRFLWIGFILFISFLVIILSVN